MLEADKDFGIHTFTCDECGEEHEVDADIGWSAVLEDLKENGWAWKAQPKGGYLHYCEDCKELLKR